MLLALAASIIGVASVIDGNTIETHGRRGIWASEFEAPWEWRRR